MDIDRIIQLRIIPATGAEQFAKFIYQKLNTFVQEETDGRVKVTQVEFMEHSKNTAIYSESTITNITKSIDRQPEEGC
jgi:6-pyruvoyltetrahydropterin/6-carboxytetrahydropterin synthase